jgi:glycerophosphoryl diester phosphodiesterase
LLIVGHRGARNLWAENGLTGFRNLVGLGVEAVEFDIHQSKDGGVVVIHDPLLERTVEAEGPVAARPLSELTSLKLRDSEDRIPTLDDVLAVYAPTTFELHIEIKTDATGTPYQGLEARALAAVAKHKLDSRAILTCFAPEVVEMVKRLSPATRVLASIDRRSAEAFGGLDRVIARFAKIPDILIAVEKSLLLLTQKQWLDAFGGDRIGVWAPNELDDLLHWTRQPIRQITTDRPDLALQARRVATI